MAKGGSKGDILHCVGTRLRITGTGVLIQKLNSLQNFEVYTQPELTMSTATDREPFTLANFNKQRMQVDIGTDAINESFQISKLVIFIKPVSEQYPNG